MPDHSRLITLLDILRGLADAIEQRFGGAEPTHPAPPETDVDQALAHAGDVARRLKLDPAALLAERGTPEQAPPAAAPDDRPRLPR